MLTKRKSNQASKKKKERNRKWLDFLVVLHLELPQAVAVRIIFFSCFSHFKRYWQRQILLSLISFIILSQYIINYCRKWSRSKNKERLLGGGMLIFLIGSSLMALTLIDKCFNFCNNRQFSVPYCWTLSAHDLLLSRSTNCLFIKIFFFFFFPHWH